MKTYKYRENFTIFIGYQNHRESILEKDDLRFRICLICIFPEKTLVLVFTRE